MHSGYHKLSPHSVHYRNLFPHEAPIHHHHPAMYSPPEQKHYVPIKHHHEGMFDKHEHVHYRHHYPAHFVPVIPNQPTSPPRENNKNKRNISPTEKKKVISRNVDRKKLSEEELEELRRRERDYQRERRARIRLEKVCLIFIVLGVRIYLYSVRTFFKITIKVKENDFLAIKFYENFDYF